jgi:hypothetical protein
VRPSRLLAGSVPADAKRIDLAANGIHNRMTVE